MATDGAEREKPARAVPEPQKVCREDSVIVDGQRLDYTVTAETVLLPGEDPRGAPRAAVFAVSYVRSGVEDPAARPVTFCFNGGPGSSAVWLHLGALGPRRVALPDATPPPPPPYRVVENPEGLLDVSDLVFIDPVGTGFSDAVGEGQPAEFTQVKGDVRSVSDFIERWLSTQGRWASPKLLAGESYGTTRAAGIAARLAERGVVLNGLVLLSAAFDFGTFVFHGANDLAYALLLPSMTATAAWHGRLGPVTDLPGLLDEARAFAAGPYLQALFAGSRLGEAERAAVAERLAALSGVAASIWLAGDLRLDQARFCKLLLADAGRVVGRLDGRYTGYDDDPQAARAERDPSYDGPLGPFAAAQNDYLRRHLGFPEPGPYAVLSEAVNRDWKDDRPWWQGWLDVSAQLRAALLASPHLQVFVGSGWTDLATPFFATEYSLAHLGREADLQARLTVAEYPAGHMMYLHPPSRAKLRADLLAFYRRAVPAG